MLAGLLLAAACAGPARAAPRHRRVSKRMAQYQDQSKGVQACSLCTLFQPPDRCKAVFGKVRPDGWCALFDMVD